MEKASNENGNVRFFPTVPTYTAPKIAHDFVDDDGELNYALENGNTTLASRYNAIWNPCKGIVNMKGRGNTIESKQRKY